MATRTWASNSLSASTHLTHRCHIFEMNGESYRFRESMKGKRGSAKNKNGTKSK